MSGIFVLAPVLAAAPVVLTATAAVATAMGFSMVSGKLEEWQGLQEAEDCVEFDINEARGLTALIAQQGPIVLQREGATVVFRPGKGRVQMLVKGTGTREELEALGQSVIDGISQQYAYHQVVSDLKARGFDKVEESQDEDGTIRLRLRRWD